MIDDLLIILLSTSMFVGGVIALLFDNTLPGTDIFSLNIDPCKFCFQKKVC